MPKKEMNSATGLSIARPRQAARLFGRALTLHCPNCGGGPVRSGWFTMRERCGNCGLRLDRGESDYFLGAIMFNLALGELLFVLAFVGTLVVTWPHPPWDVLQWAIPVMVVAAPLACFPFSKLVWIAFDLAMRPMTAEEMEWHRSDAPRDGMHGPPKR